MSFFSKTSAAATERLTAALSALDAAGIKIEAAAPIPAPEAVASAIEARIKAATDPLASQLAASQARVTGLTAALAASGIVLPDLAATDFAVAEGATEAPAAAKLRTAIEATVSRRASQAIAATGHPAAIPVPRTVPAADASSAAPANAEEFVQRYEAMSASDPAAATAYWRKHKSLFVR